VESSSRMDLLMVLTKVTRI